MVTTSATFPKPTLAKPATTAGGKPPFWLRALRTSVWTALGVVAAVVVTEALFTVAHIGEEEFVDVHPTIGFWHMPNRLVTWRSEGYSQSKTNTDGMRDINFPADKPAGVKRIAFTGDSMVEGYQVAPEQTFVKLIADRFTKDGITAQGLNFGMSGYSTVQNLYLFKEKVLKYHPDMVVVAYHIGDNEKNQFAPSPGGFMPRPHALLEKGLLKTDWRGYDVWWDGPMHQQYSANSWLRTNSRIWGVLTKLELQASDLKWYANLKKAMSGKSKQPLVPERFTSTASDFGVDATALDTSFVKLPQANWLYLPIDKNLPPAVAKEVSKERDISVGWRMILNNSNERFAVTGACLDLLNRACKKAGCKLVVAGLPAPDNSLLYKRELLMMNKLAKQSGFTFVDINAEFPQIAPMQPSDFYYNVHFTPRGHELVADILYKHLKQSGLFDYLRTSS